MTIPAGILTLIHRPSWHFNVDSPVKQRQGPRLDQHWIMFRFCKSNQRWFCNVVSPLTSWMLFHCWCRDVVSRSLLSILVSKSCMSKLNQHLIMLRFCKLNQRCYRDIVSVLPFNMGEYNYTLNYNVVWIHDHNNANWFSD